MKIAQLREDYERKLQAMQDLLDKQAQRIVVLEIENARLKGQNEGFQKIIEVMDNFLLNRDDKNNI